MAYSNYGKGGVFLAAASTTLAAKNAYDAVSAGQNVKDGNLADKAGGISISVSVGSSKSQSTTTQYSNTGAASHLTAGGDITIQAKGGDQDSDLTIRGSQIRAGGNVALGADDEIKLLAGRNDSTQSSQNSSSSGSIGVGFNLGAGSTGFSVNASASKGKGNSNGSDTQWDETLIQAGNKIDLKSGGDTTLKGAIVEGKQIVADIGGNLSIESLQDKSTYDSKRSNSGFSISVPVTGGGSIGGNVSAGKSKIDSNYQSVVEQSGFKAGDNGFQVTVKGDTDLKGAVIASTDKAIEEGKNSFKTDGTLTLASLDNNASYQGKATGINFGAGVSMDGKLAPGGTSAGSGKDQGSASSTTQSGISGITGNQEARSGDSGNGIGKIFDAQKVQEKIDAQVQITQMFGQLAPKAVADFAETQARDLKTQAAQESDPEKKAALLAAADKWAEGGAYRILLHTTVGGLAGGDAGALGAGTVATAAPLLSELQEHVTQVLKDAGAGDGLAKLAGQLIAQGTAAGIGAAASGGNTAGAAMGLNVDANNRQLHPSEKQRIKELAKGNPEKEARLTAAACALVRCYAEYPEGSAIYNELKALANLGASDAFSTERSLLQGQSGLFVYSTTGFLNDRQTDSLKRINNTYQITTRSLGGIEAITGGAGFAASVVTAPASCATGIGCVANATVATLSIDALYTGSKQLISGQSEATMLNQGLQGLGLSPEAASYTEFILGVGATAKAGSIINNAIKLDAAANAWAKGTYTGDSAISFEGRVYRFADKKYANTTWEIYPGNISANYRYSESGVGAVYSGTSIKTAAAEVGSYRDFMAPLSPKVLVGGDVKISGVLDLTDSSALKALGVTREEIIQSSHGVNGSYIKTQQISEWARSQGYNAILAPSAQNKSGTNLITFDSTKVTNVRKTVPY